MANFFDPYASSANSGAVGSGYWPTETKPTNLSGLDPSIWAGLGGAAAGFYPSAAPIAAAASRVSSAAASSPQQAPAAKPANDFSKQLLAFASGVYNDQQNKQNQIKMTQAKSAAQSKATASQFGAYTNSAMNTMTNNAKLSQATMQSLMNQALSDPAYKTAQNFALQGATSAGIGAPASLDRYEQLAMQAPMGLDPKGLQTILGNLARRSAAMGSGSMRSIASRAAGLGVTGPALMSAQNQERLGRGAGLNSAMANSELDWDMKNQDVRSQMMNQLAQAASMRDNLNRYNQNNRLDSQKQIANIASMRYGAPLQAAGMYSNALMQDNPLARLASMQQMAAPFQQLPQSQVAGSTSQPQDMTGLLALMMGALGGGSGGTQTLVNYR
jgi:hypothetical protein